MDFPEPAGYPVLTCLCYFLGAAAHEVPPHQQPLTEWRAAEHEEPGVPAPSGRREPDLGQAGRQVGEQAGNVTAGGPAGRAQLFACPTWRLLARN